MSKDAPEKRKPQPLTPRQRKYVKGVVDGQSKKQAALAAGYTESMAAKPQDKIENPAVKAAFADLLERAGITDELLAQRIFEGLSAMESKFFVRKFPMKAEGDENGEATHVVDELIQRDCIAFSERRAMVETVIKLKGLIVEKHEHRVTLEDLLGESHE